MIKIGVYSVYDSKAEAYLPPWTAQSDGLAIRNFEDAIRQEGHAFRRHARDFSLFRVGTFNQASALLEHQVPFALAAAHEVRAKIERDDARQLDFTKTVPIQGGTERAS